MELASGTDVRALAPMPWREACAMLRDVASALSLLHSRRLVHRDVNPLDTPQEIVMTVVGSGPLVVNVDSPDG